MNEDSKKKIFVSKSKPFVKTAAQISSEREKVEKDKKIEEAATDMSKLIDTFANIRKEKKNQTKVVKNNGLRLFILLILLAFLINLLLFNIWAFGTMLKSIIGWFS